MSCDWWRAGHVTTVLTSDWSGGCRPGPGDTARRRLAAAGVTGTISTYLILISNDLEQIDCVSSLYYIYIISTIYLFHIYAGAARRAPAPARQCRAPGETTGSWFRIFILNYQRNGNGHGEGINWSCLGASAGAATRGATARELPPAGRGRVASSWRRMDAGADVDMKTNYINRDKHVDKFTKCTTTIH